MNNKTYYLIALAIMTLAESGVAYNGRDLKHHTECLVEAVLTGEDLDAAFVRRHLSIGCDQQDVADTQGEEIEAIIANFLANPIVEIFNAEDCIAKFRELSGILGGVSRAPASPAEKASCILIAKESSRNLLGTLFDSIKDGDTKTRLEGARRAFLESLESKRLDAAGAVAFEDERVARGSPKAPASPVLSAEVIAQIHVALPYIASLSAQQLREVALFFKSLRIE